MGALSFYSTPTSTIIISTFHSKITTNLISYYDKKEHTTKFAQQHPISHPQSPQVIKTILICHPSIYSNIYSAMLSAITLPFSIAIRLRASFREPVINAVRLSNSLADRLSASLTGYQTGSHRGSLAVRLASYLAGWLARGLMRLAYVGSCLLVKVGL